MTAIPQRRRSGVPVASSPAALRRMRSAKRRDTKPELQLRSELHRLGMRFRVDVAPIPGIRRRADVVFPRSRVAVFVDGCFWHGCPEHATWPKANADWWRTKIEGNRRRDEDTNCRLREAGWTVLRVWEHESSVIAARGVARAVREAGANRAR